MLCGYNENRQIPWVYVKYKQQEKKNVKKSSSEFRVFRCVCVTYDPTQVDVENGCLNNFCINSLRLLRTVFCQRVYLYYLQYIIRKAQMEVNYS